MQGSPRVRLAGTERGLEQGGSQVLLSPSLPLPAPQSSHLYHGGVGGGLPCLAALGSTFSATGPVNTHCLNPHGASGRWGLLSTLFYRGGN